MGNAAGAGDLWIPRATPGGADQRPGVCRSGPRELKALKYEQLRLIRYGPGSRHRANNGALSNFTDVVGDIDNWVKTVEGREIQRGVAGLR